MKYRRLGSAGMQVSAVSVGGWINFGENKVDQDSARQVIETSYQRGINFFDIADIYGKGEAEKQIGAILKQYARHTLVISSKVYFPMSEEINDRGLSRKHIMESIDKTLQRTGAGYLDIYFCHRPDPETPILETARAMDDLIHQGKILYWGTSEWPAASIQEAYDLCERYNLYPPQSEQPQYSLLKREPVETEVLPVTTKTGIGLVVWSPLAGGMLTGKYDHGIPEGTRFAREQWLHDTFVNERNRTIVRKLTPIAADLDVTRGQLALAWVLRQPGVSSVITGATKPTQVDENVRAAELELSDDVIAAIEEIVSAA